MSALPAPGFRSRQRDRESARSCVPSRRDRLFGFRCRTAANRSGGLSRNGRTAQPGSDRTAAPAIRRLTGGWVQDDGPAAQRKSIVMSPARLPAFDPRTSARSSAPGGGCESSRSAGAAAVALPASFMVFRKCSHSPGIRLRKECGVYRFPRMQFRYATS